MRGYFPWIVVVLSFLSSGNLFGKIRNGHEPQLYNSVVTLHRLKLRMVEEKNMSAVQRHSLKSKMKDVINYITLYDHSGKSAELFQKMFLQDRKEYIRNGGVKPQSPLALINPIRRNIKNTEEYPSQIAKQFKAPFRAVIIFDRAAKVNGVIASVEVMLR